MASLNKVMLIGNLTRDPELRVTPKGTASRPSPPPADNVDEDVPF